MPEGHFVLTRIGPTLVVTLEGTADAATLATAGETIAGAHSRERPRASFWRFLGARSSTLRSLWESRS